MLHGRHIGTCNGRRILRPRFLCRIVRVIVHSPRAALPRLLRPYGQRKLLFEYRLEGYIGHGVVALFGEKVEVAKGEVAPVFRGEMGGGAEGFEGGFDMGWSVG